MTKHVYGHFAKEDFTDAVGVFHPKDSCCYIGSGVEARAKQMTSKGGNRSVLHSSSRELLYVKYIEECEDSTAIDREIYWYWHYKNLGHNLFNKSAPSKRKYFSYDVFKELFYINPESPSYLSWIDPPFFGRNFKNKDYAGKLSHKREKDGRLDYKCWIVSHKKVNYRVHSIVWVLHNKQDLPTDKLVMHLDNDASNNNPSNLKLGTQADNRKSKRPQGRNKSGIDGVVLIPQHFCYKTKINNNEGKPLSSSFCYVSEERKYKPKYSTKVYATKEEAFKAACLWRLDKCKEFGYDTTWWSEDLVDQTPVKIAE